MGDGNKNDHNFLNNWDILVLQKRKW
jgi:hypothetical protein